MRFKFTKSDSILLFNRHTVFEDLLYCADANEAGTSFTYFNNKGFAIRKDFFAFKEQVWMSELLQAFI